MNKFLVLVKDRQTNRESQLCYSYGNTVFAAHKSKGDLALVAVVGIDSSTLLPCCRQYR
jgi:hypothetical protein